MRIAALLFCSLLLPLPASCQSPPRQSPPSPPSAQESQQQDPKQADVSNSALRERAAAAENQGRFGDAADAFLLLTQREPQRSEWVVEAGRCLGRSGRFRDAIDLLDAARKTFPGVIEVPAMLARTLLLEAESSGALYPEILWTDAAALAEGVLELDPNHLDSRLLLAQARYLLGETEVAIRVSQEAVRRHPEHPGAHILMGRFAMDRFRQLLAVHQQDAKDDAARTAELVATLDAQRQAALAAFRRAIEIDPTRAHPHIALAQIALLDKKDDVARAHFADALVADPTTALDHYALCRDLDWQGRRDFYTGILQRYLARADRQALKSAALRWHLGRALFDGQQWQDASTSFLAALAEDPSTTNGYYYLCFAAYHREDYDGAERYAAAYAALGAASFADVLRSLDVEARGQARAVLQFLGDRAYQRGNKAPSRDINHVIACLVDSADAWNNHAFLCRETELFEEARSSYQHALEREPQSAQLWNDAAVILQYHLATPENLTRARTMYERALELAAKTLTDSGSTPTQRQAATKAAGDARANLAELERN